MEFVAKMTKRWKEQKIARLPGCHVSIKGDWSGYKSMGNEGQLYGSKAFGLQLLESKAVV